MLNLSKFALKSNLQKKEKDRVIPYMRPISFLLTLLELSGPSWAVNLLLRYRDPFGFNFLSLTLRTLQFDAL